MAEEKDLNLRRNSEMNRKVKFNLHDQAHPYAKPVQGSISLPEKDFSQLLIRFKGYGDCCSAEGHGVPIILERYEGKLRLIVWADINKEDPTHIIDLEEAREDNRKED